MMATDDPMAEEDVPPDTSKNSDQNHKMVVAARVCDLIKAAGMTQRAAAERLGIDQPKVSALLRRRLTGFSVQRLLRFLEALDPNAANELQYANQALATTGFQLSRQPQSSLFSNSPYKERKMPTVNTAGLIFSNFSARQGYTPKARQCMVNTVANLLGEPTSSDKPGMLLGKVQSGKTRTFLGVMALAFDNGYDVAIVFTKGTKALARQTLARLYQDYKPEIESDLIHVFDIMSLPANLTDYELSHKLVIVCKKEDDNINRLSDAIFDTYPDLATRRTLIIDDEADFASVGFRRTRAEGIQINKIAEQIDDLRQRLTSASFLQVTATPYSLYLQPEDMILPDTQQVFKPVRPAFTELVPIHDEYVGGEYYFEESQNADTVASYLHIEVDNSELGILKRQDRRSFKIEESLTSESVASLRRAIVTFIVGGWIRRWQEDAAGRLRPKYSFIVHTDTSRSAHNWQEEIVHRIQELLGAAAEANDDIIRDLVGSAYDDLQRSVSLLGDPLPTLDEVLQGFPQALGMLMISTVNSEKEIGELLDDSGQLKLRTPFNIFIGGQILDRGITIANLIGFFYGRSPNRFQQDTVLQHSRMYGKRPLADLAVTRFYTTLGIYSAMRTIHNFDSALRDAFEQDGHDQGVVFLRADPNRGVIPCSPNKILLSTVTTVRPGDRFLPVGFTTDAKFRAQPHTTAIDQLVMAHAVGESSPPFLIDIETANQIIDHVAASLVMDEDYTWDSNALKATLAHLAAANPNVPERNQIACLVRRNRDMGKFRSGGRLQDAPDSKIERQAIDAYRGSRPAILLYRQNGRADLDWNGCEFWWPVLIAPPDTRTVIFASDTVD